jgi:hypothetical protein
MECEQRVTAELKRIVSRSGRNYGGNDPNRRQNAEMDVSRGNGGDRTMTRIEANAGVTLHPFLGAVTESHDHSTVTKRIGQGSTGAAVERFPSIEDILREDRLFDRLAAVA